MAFPLQHTVAFRLNDGVDQEQFLAQARGLADLPGVLEFEVLDQVSEKSSQYDLALSMWFNSDVDYANYNEHPDHVRFVQNVWIPNVAEFLELDYLRLAQ